MTPERIIIETIGWTGAALILAAYILLSAGGSAANRGSISG